MLNLLSIVEVAEHMSSKHAFYKKKFYKKHEAQEKKWFSLLNYVISCWSTTFAKNLPTSWHVGALHLLIRGIPH